MQNTASWSEKKQGYILLGILSFIFSTYCVLFRTTNITNDNLVKINNLVVRQKPVIQKYIGRNSTKEWISIYFNDINKEFQIVEEEYSCCRKNEILNIIQVGDTLSIKMLKNEIDNINNSQLVDNFNRVYGIEKDDTDLCNLTCSNKKATKNNTFIYSVGYFVAFLLIFTHFLKKQPIVFGINVDIGFLIAIISITFIMVYFILQNNL